MLLLFLDFETYYDRDYSLRKMTPAEYILDPRFEAICLGVAKDAEPPELVDGPDIGSYLAALPAAQTTTVTYNALFDNAILAWRYDFRPARMVDGLGMARALLGTRLRKLGLADVAKHLGVGSKGDELHYVIGMHRADIKRDQDLWDRFGAYCRNDTALLREIVDTLHGEFPEEEYDIMDAVLRTCIEPVFHCDVELLQKHLGEIRAEKAALCEAVGADKDAVSGNGSFLQLLQNAGVEVKYKQGKNGLIPAIAKTDQFMNDLLEDERTDVQCLAAARLGVKSTLEEKRSERLISIASLSWPNSQSLMPIPLRYSGAHTWRLSGDWKINMQNLPSARMGDPVLRRSLMASTGSKIVVGDLAQIEARLVAWFCGCEKLLTEFRTKIDPYSRLAEQIFGAEEGTIGIETMQGVARHIGKAGILGCGYGMGKDKFYASVLRSGRSMLDARQMEMLTDVWTPPLAEKSVNAYRNRYFEVPQMWGKLDRALHTAWLGKLGAADWISGPVRLFNRGGCGVVEGPGGREIRYPGAMLDDRGLDDGGGELWWCDGGVVPKKIYGAACLENIIQFLARIVMFDIAMRLKARGLRFIHQVHDELVFCVHNNDVQEATTVVKDEMRTPPAWCKDLPLDCGVGHGQRYGDCK